MLVTESYGMAVVGLLDALFYGWYSETRNFNYALKIETPLQYDPRHSSRARCHYYEGNILNVQHMRLGYFNN